MALGGSLSPAGLGEASAKPPNELAGTITQWIETGKFLLMQEIQILSKQENVREL